MDFRLLKEEEIDVKIKQVTKKGAVALIYKTARVDMDILDETVGADMWQNQYQTIDGVLFCGIGIEKNDKWIVWKWSNGIESRDDGGNEKKGEASDAFKRAGFMWGIGRELYTAPFIFLNLPTVEKSGNGRISYELADKFEKFHVSKISYDSTRKIVELKISDDHGKIVFDMKKKSADKPVCGRCGTEVGDVKMKDGSVMKGGEFLNRYGMCPECYREEVAAARGEA